MAAVAVLTISAVQVLGAFHTATIRGVTDRALERSPRAMGVARAAAHTEPDCWNADALVARTVRISSADCAYGLLVDAGIVARAILVITAVSVCDAVGTRTRRDIADTVTV